MKQFYSLALAATLSIGAYAATTLPMASLKDIAPRQHAIKSAKKTVKSQNGVAKIVSTPSGLLRKELPGKFVNQKLSLKSAVAKTRAAAEEAGAGMTESFEGWDGEIGWAPEGWEIKVSAAKTPEESWQAISGENVDLTPRDGEILMACPISKDSIDEWLITPQVTIESGMKLSYDEMVAAVWLYSFENIDWDTESYVGGPIEICDLEVLISEDNGENWTLLRSAADVNKNRSYADMAYDITAYDFKNVTIDLAAYNGKSVKFAFRSVGYDTNLVAVDAVTVGYPPVSLDVVPPASEFNLGVGKNLNMMLIASAYNPAYTPLTWSNYSENPGASYVWHYVDAEGNNVESADADLTVTYRPACAFGDEDDNNIYLYPTLIGSGEGYSQSQWTHNDVMVIGGKPAIGMEDGTSLELGVGYCDMSRDKFDFATDYWTGEPIFGYGPSIDTFWSDYTFGGQQDENNWVKMTGIMNIHLSPETPMVINGGWLPAAAQIQPEAKFVMDILKVDEEGNMDLTPIATDTVAGSEIIYHDDPADVGFVTVPFTFDEPLVISSADCPMFVVRFSGFNDAENVSFFAPLNSANADVLGREIGWLWKDMCQNGVMNYSLSPISNYTGVPNGFYIMLDAEYSHLVAEKNEVELNGSEPVEVTIDTYRAAEELTVTGAPEWLKVEVSGQGPTGKVKFTGNGAKGDTAEVTVSGLGASTTFTVKMVESTGIVNTAAPTGAREYYNLQGMKVANCIPGEVYILRQGSQISKIRF